MRQPYWTIWVPILGGCLLCILTFVPEFQHDARFGYGKRGVPYSWTHGEVHRQLLALPQNRLGLNFIQVNQPKLTDSASPNSTDTNLPKSLSGNVNVSDLVIHRLLDVEHVDCLKLFEGDEAERNRARRIMHTTKLKSLPDSLFPILTADCQSYKVVRGYSQIPLSKEEENFPLAFSILMHRNVAQFERLLLTLYQPQNLYCVHIDKKADPLVHKAIESIANCFGNVIIASKLEDVVYASVFRLQADINCMHDLVNNPYYPWKYMVNLVSEELPLKTNDELVKIFKIYNGANDVEGLAKRVIRGRFDRQFVVKPPDPKNCKKNDPTRYNCESPFVATTGEKKDPPPRHITIVRGSAFGAFSRGFVEYVVTNPYAIDLLEWSQDTYSPDEHYWATLNHLKQNAHLKTPGGYAGEPDDKPFLATYAAWAGRDKCGGRWSRGVCVFGIADLPYLMSLNHLFVNKLHLEFEPLAYECLEQWLHNKTLLNRQHSLPFNGYFYRNLPHVLQHY